MFDKLDLVKQKWQENTPIIIRDTLKRGFLALPAQLVFHTALKQFRKLGGEGIYLLMGHSIFRDLKIPLISSLYKGMSSRYPLIHLMDNHGTHPIKNQSISIGVRTDDIDVTDKKLSDCIRNLGDTIEDRASGQISSDNFMSTFINSFITPGKLKIVKGEHTQLRETNHINELSLALCEISSYSPCIILVPIIEENGKYFQIETEDDELDNYFTIDSSVIINLWRSIKKISRDEISYLK